MDSQNNGNPTSKKRHYLPLVIAIGVIVVLAGAAYFYLNRSSDNGGANPSGPTSCSGGQQPISIGSVSTCAPPINGTATAVSSTSITVQPDSGGSTMTFSITSTTQFQGNGVSAAADIHIGDKVNILVVSPGSHVAIVVGVNPKGA